MFSQSSLHLFLRDWSSFVSTKIRLDTKLIKHFLNRLKNREHIRAFGFENVKRCVTKHLPGFHMRVH